MWTYELPKREIKFRVWDDNFMIYFDMNGLYNSWYYRVVDGVKVYYWWWNLFWDIVKHWCDFMQYTWLKDKNWVEIYEGDLLKFTTDYLEYLWHKTSDNYRRNNYALYEVFFHDNDCCDTHIGFQMNRRHTKWADWEIQINPQFKPKITKECEVIWNIFENPELLETNNPTT